MPYCASASDLVEVTVPEPYDASALTIAVRVIGHVDR